MSGDLVDGRVSRPLRDSVRLVDPRGAGGNDHSRNSKSVHIPLLLVFDGGQKR
jgi:hypothetical protein